MTNSKVSLSKSILHNRAYGGCNLLLIRHNVFFHRQAERYGDIKPADPFRGRLQAVENLDVLNHGRDDFSGRAACPAGFIYNDEPACLHYRGLKTLSIQRHMGAVIAD